MTVWPDSPEAAGDGEILDLDLDERTSLEFGCDCETAEIGRAHV